MAAVAATPAVLARPRFLNAPRTGRAAGCCVVRAASSSQGPRLRTLEPPPPASSSSSAASSSSTSVPLSQPPTASSSGTAAAAAATDASAITAARTYRVSPWQAMRFNGPVPERVNGRLAMLAFLWIARQEMETGQTVIQQAQQLPTNYGAWPLVALMLLMVYATFPPALAGAKEEDFGFMSVAAEKTNMRAAMLGLAVLAALEWHSGYCFF